MKSLTKQAHDALVQPYVERIERLEDELADMWQRYLELAPPEFHEILVSYGGSPDDQEPHRWRESAAQAIIEKALRGNSAERARCPICGEAGGTPKQPGYALPEGLRQHLTGSYNARECLPLRVAMNLSRRRKTRK